MYLRMATDTKGVWCPSEVWPQHRGRTGRPGALWGVIMVTHSLATGFQKGAFSFRFVLWSKDLVQFPVKPFPTNFIKWSVTLASGSNVQDFWASAILMTLVSQSLSLPSVCQRSIFLSQETPCQNLHMICGIFAPWSYELNFACLSSSPMAWDEHFLPLWAALKWCFSHADLEVTSFWPEGDFQVPLTTAVLS